MAEDDGTTIGLGGGGIGGGGIGGQRGHHEGGNYSVGMDKIATQQKQHQ